MLSAHPISNHEFDNEVLGWSAQMQHAAQENKIPIEFRLMSLLGNGLKRVIDEWHFRLNTIPILVDRTPTS